MIFGSISQIDCISWFSRSKTIIESCLNWFRNISDDTLTGTFKIDHGLISVEYIEEQKRPVNNHNGSWVSPYQCLEIHFIHTGSAHFDVINLQENNGTAHEISNARQSFEQAIVSATLKAGGICVIFPNEKYKSRPVFDGGENLRKAVMRIPVQRLFQNKLF